MAVRDLSICHGDARDGLSLSHGHWGRCSFRRSATGLAPGEDSDSEHGIRVFSDSSYVYRATMDGGRWTVDDGNCGAMGSGRTRPSAALKLLILIPSAQTVRGDERAQTMHSCSCSINISVRASRSRLQTADVDPRPLRSVGHRSQSPRIYNITAMRLCYTMGTGRRHPGACAHDRTLSSVSQSNTPKRPQPLTHCLVRRVDDGHW